MLLDARLRQGSLLHFFRTGLAGNFHYPTQLAIHLHGQLDDHIARQRFIPGRPGLAVDAAGMSSNMPQFLCHMRR